MIFIARFSNKPEVGTLLRQHYPAHVEWLKQHESVIILAGALRTELDTNPVGGLWLVRANSKSEVEALFRTDPFWVQGLRQSYEVLLWTNALPEKTILL
jgi:uncharacterized protein